MNVNNKRFIVGWRYAIDCLRRGSFASQLSGAFSPGGLLFLLGHCFTSPPSISKLSPPEIFLN